MISNKQTLSMSVDCGNLDTSSDTEDCIDFKDDEEDIDYSTGSISKLQFRKEVSTAQWDNEMEMAEVIENKGRLWTTTGIVRNAKVYCSVEETLYLMEIGALVLLDDNGSHLSLKIMYEKLDEGNGRCCWEHFEVYRHLKSLGYIVGRHGIPWSMKSCKSKANSVSSEDIQESVGENFLIERLSNTYIGEIEVEVVFDVYLPNSKFRKSSPGNPSFLLCVVRGCPPSRAAIEHLERRYHGISLKISHVEHGRVSFFSFDRVELPTLP